MWWRTLGLRPTAGAITGLMAKFITHDVPNVEENFADFVQRGAADWERRARADGEPLSIQISHPEKEEMRAGISKMVQLFAMVASNTSILATVIDTLQTELFRRLFDRREGLNEGEQERLYLALQFLLKLLHATADASATGIGMGVFMMRQLWLRHCESMGRHLPDRARQIL